MCLTYVFPVTYETRPLVENQERDERQEVIRTEKKVGKSYFE